MERRRVERRRAVAASHDGPVRPAGAGAGSALVRLSRLLGLDGRDTASPSGLGRVVAHAHARDAHTLAHSFRGARYAMALAHHLGVDDQLAAAIEWGALLHDVGKVAVPVEILQKVGPLTAEEEVVMRRHPRHGYQLVRDIVFLGPALDVVLSHHERWDGDGYPNGLAGDSIPLAARIFAIADTYDAITSDRPYRRARGHREAVAELTRVAGTQLDPHLVAAFLAIPQARLAELRDQAPPDWREVAELDGAAGRAVVRGG